MKMKTDIDKRRGERIISKHKHGGCIRFSYETYAHPALKPWIGFPVIVCGYGYGGVDVYLIARVSKKHWGKGKFLCFIED